MKKFILCAISLCLMAGIVNGAVEAKEIKVKCRITKYSKAECPNKYTSSGKIPKEGMVALSRDLYKEFNIPYGASVYVEGYKERDRFYAEDKVGIKITKKDKTGKLYNHYLTRTIDIYEEHIQEKRYLNKSTWVTITWEH